MTRTRWLIAGSWLLLFWLIAGLVWLPAIQRRLEEKASLAIADIATGYPAVEIRFSGQTATLTGNVRHQTEKDEIQKRIAGTLRLPWPLASDWNPVSQVHNAVELAPYPAGWILLAAQGPHAALYGTLATEAEARDMGLLLQERWIRQGGRLTSQLQPDFSRFDEAPAVQNTLDQLPSPRLDGGGDAAQVHLARPGLGWERLPLDAPDDHLRQQFASYPISETEWTSLVLPALKRIRSFQSGERTRLAEIEHQSKLPPPHVFFAVRDQRLLLRGEVASIKIKRELLNHVIVTFPDRRVIDDLRVNDSRRAVADFGPITTALLPQADESGPGKSLFLGLSGAAWQAVDWQVGEEAAPWAETLPADLPAKLLQEDSRMVTQWLQGGALGIPSLPILAQPSFLTLTLLPDKVILAGQLAEEALRTQLVESVRRIYGGQAVIFSEALLVRGTCQPTADVEQTIRSLPPLPKTDKPPVVAFAQPGQVWKSLPASEDLLKPGALSQSALIPQGFPAAMAEDTFFSEAYDHLRHHWRKPPPPAKRDKPTR